MNQYDKMVDTYNRWVDEREPETKPPEPLMNPNIYYYNIIETDEHLEIYVIITSRYLWDTKKQLCDGSIATPLAESLGLEELSESMYTYNGMVGGLRAIMRESGIRENKELTIWKEN